MLPAAAAAMLAAALAASFAATPHQSPVPPPSTPALRLPPDGQACHSRRCPEDFTNSTLAGAFRRWRDCHFTDIPSPPLLKHLY